MRQIPKKFEIPLWCVLSLALSALGIVLYSGLYMKVTALLAGVLVLVLAARSGDVAPLRSPFVWPLAGYVLFAGLSGLWAITGRYHLESYLQLFTVFCVFLFLLLRKRNATNAAHGMLALIAVTAGIYGFLSVLVATMNFVEPLLKETLGLLNKAATGQFRNRMYGIFGNPNVEATIFAYGIFFSVALLCDEKSRGRRALFAVTLAFCAYPMLLGFSMGALACFGVAILLFLVFAGTQRVAVLTQMLVGALPALTCAFAAFRLKGNTFRGGLPPLLLLFLCAALCIVLELTLADRMAAFLDKRKKLAIGFPIAVLALIVAFVVIAISVHKPHAFGEAISRSFYPTTGEHTLHIDADGSVTVNITCSSMDSILYSSRFKPTVVYDGSDTEITFTVPEDSVLCTFVFSAEDGVTLRSATLDGAKAVPLDYPLLPTYVVTRMQNLRYDTNALSRRQMAADALKLWRMSPVAGNGLGAFEVGAQMVKYIPYTTKYVHDHYAQTLCEVGVIGFLLWIAALIAPIAALWRKRRDTEHPMRWCYAALWAAVVQVVLQSYTDVLFSFVVTLWYAFAVFALILRGFVTDVAAERAANEQPDAHMTKRERTAAEKAARTRDRTIRAALAAPIIVFLLTVCGFWAAQSVSERAVATQSEYFSNLERAAKLDLYNADIYQYNYLVESMQSPTTERERAVADEFAGKLTRSRIKYVPSWLMTYFLGSGQYARGVEEANVAAAYFACNQDIWTQVASQLRVAFDKPDTPLAFEGGDALLEGLMQYRAALEQHNAESLIKIKLDEENEAFFAKVAEAYAHKDDSAEIFRVFSAK